MRQSSGLLIFCVVGWWLASLTYPHCILKIRTPLFNHIVIGPIKLSIMVFPDITQFSLLNRDQRFGGKTASVFGLEDRSDDGGSKFKANLGIYLRNDPSCIIFLKAESSSKRLYQYMKPYAFVPSSCRQHVLPKFWENFTRDMTLRPRRR